MQQVIRGLFSFLSYMVKTVLLAPNQQALLLHCALEMALGASACGLASQKNEIQVSKTWYLCLKVRTQFSTQFNLIYYVSDFTCSRLWKYYKIGNGTGYSNDIQCCLAQSLCKDLFFLNPTSYVPLKLFRSHTEGLASFTLGFLF